LAVWISFLGDATDAGATEYSSPDTV